MKKCLLFLLTAILSLNCYSQITYEKGYYIDNMNQKINCLIKNVDWKNNPTEFEYKLSENSEPKRANLESVKEFGINNISKYIRNTVDIDRSSEDLNKLSNYKKPIFKKEKLFLKVLVEGKSNLYQYVEGNLKRYFYNKDNSNVEQLIFKSYRVADGKVGKNNRFKQQLWNDLKCPSFKMGKIESLKYKKNELVKFFVEYNKCNNQEYVNFEEKRKKDLFNLTVRPRLNSSSLTIQNSVSKSRNTDFGNKIGFGLGIEAEFILPFNKNKWTITVEPTYQSFKSEKKTNVNNVSGGILIADVDYSSVEIPVGLRYYFFLNNNSKIFIDASYIFDLSSESSIEFKKNDGSNINSLEIKTRRNMAMGIGYKQNDKYSLEIRYQTSREILGSYLFWNSEYKVFSVIFGYSLF